ncbi:MAG: His-Xaa-Ser system radical SAM maturase HxsB [Sandaracinaceae bacterium]|nr:His-Xaa-Ser system radical SAM maturase HxsB [Myxococcales bacterium]
MKHLPLAKGFHAESAYRPASYELLPFRFLPLDAERYVLTNLVGEYVVLGRAELHALVEHRIDVESSSYRTLISRGFVREPDSSLALELLAARYRTQREPLRTFTALHIFVVTLRCDHSCPYCQVSRVTEDKQAFDMTKETADRSIDLVFQSPSPYLKIEFQGGEPLLNFGLIQYVVEEAERRNDGRTVEFVIATNLSPLTDEMLRFCRDHQVQISTSLDGPEWLHNKNRPKRGNDSHRRTVEGIERVRAALGPNGVSALMTTSIGSLKHPKGIIDEYVRLGFRSIFLRWISPYGFALRSTKTSSYETEQFLDFYKRGLDYVLELNKQGVPFQEEYASIILRKMLTPWGSGYADLQSPTSLGLSVLVYNYDGDVYASDEGRMLAEMDDFTFRLGNVHRESYRDLFLASDWLSMVSDTMSEGLPGCVDCAMQPYCGTDPVFHHATQGDMVGHRPTSDFCRRNMEIMRHLIRLMEDEPEARAILRSWA